MVLLECGNVHTHVRVNDENSKHSKQQVIDYLRSNLKYENPFWSQGEAHWESRYTYLMTLGGRIETGLIGFVTGLLKQAGIPYKLVDNQTQVDSPDADDIERRMNRLSVTLRDYQEDAVFEGICYKRGMFDLATGAGKTVVMAGLTAIWNLRTLIVVDSTDLAAQIREELEEFTGERVGLVGSGVWQEERITVGMVSTLTNKNSSTKKKAQIKKFLGTIEHLVFDEVHHSQAATWRAVSKGCTNAPVRHGCSGTCFSSEVTMENGERVSNRDALLIAHTGPVIYSKKTKELVEEGYLSKPTINIFRNHVYYDGVKLQHQAEYMRVIAQDEERNDLAAMVVKKTHEIGEQTIIFVDRIEHGENFAILLEDKYGIPPHDICYVTGQKDKASRREAILDFKEKRLPIIIGTVLGEGLNFFAKTGINLAGGASKKNVIQRLGRVLRKERDPETGDVLTSEVRCVDYYDFLDLGHPWYERHGSLRYNTYKNEGHDIQVVQLLQGHVVSSGIESLPIKGDNLKTIYREFTQAYRPVGQWKWRSGEKPRVKQLFVHLAEALNIREADHFDDAVSAFCQYLDKYTKQWLGWDSASRDNYIGFLLSKKNIEIFAAKQVLGVDAEIAGTATNDEWDV